MRFGAIRSAAVLLVLVGGAWAVSSREPATAAGLHGAPVAPQAHRHATSSPSSCFWRGPATGKGTYNAAFPDLGATYWTAMFSMPAGSHLHIGGQFPHARYMSMNSYDQNGVATSATTDVTVVADPGATNPFVAGADRTATARSYSLTVLDQPAPTTPAPNTLYAGVSGQTTQILIYRVYVADQGTGVGGGVGLPNVSVTLADNSTVTGTKACKAIGASRQLPPTLAFPLSVYLTLRGSGATFPAQDPPVFWREFSIGALVGCVYQASCGGTPALTPGQYSNLDNAYAVAMVNRGFPEGPVLVLHGKLPVTPKTQLGQATMASSVDMRYWSLCQNESLATTKVASCVDDEQVPVDGAGNYTIVSSTTKDRPRKATTACGVAWLAWPKNGDGAGHPNDGTLILRNMLPDPGFASALQAVTQPGQETTTLGSYLPIASYTTKAAFSTPACP